jgi:hypothetical protein
VSGQAVEAIHKHLEATVLGITIAGGYNIPSDFRLVTRNLLMWDQTGNAYPAAIIQVEDVTPEPIEFCYGYEARVRFRVIVYFKAPGPDTPSTVAHRYLAAIEQAYMQDISRGGYADWTEPDPTPTTLIWRDNGPETVFEATACGTVVLEYDPRTAPVLS